LDSIQHDEREVTTSAAEELFRHVFGDSRGLLCISALERHTEKMQERFFNYPNAASTAAEFALEKAEQGKDVYFCAHLLTRSRRTKENAGPVRAFYADGDGATVPDDLPPPTAIVESSPGKHHLYWRLNSETPPETAEGINKQITSAIEADPSGYDLTQLLRVPETANYKYPDAPTVRIVSLSEDSYSPAELAAAFPDISEESTNGHRLGTDHGEPPIDLNPHEREVWEGKKPVAKETGEVDRSKTLMKIGRVLFDAGLNGWLLAMAIGERDGALGYEKYTGNRDGGEREYLRIVEKLAKEGRNPRINFRTGSSSSAPAPEPPPDPEIAPEAFRGVFGEIVDAVDPHIEGDPVAVLLSSLVAVGNAMGRGPYVQIGATKHRCNLFCGIVGDTAKARKGTTWEPIRDLMHAADRHWTEGRVTSGLSSGEGLIAEVRDPISVPGKDSEMKVVDLGVKDKRLLVMEGELAQALKVMKREGNTLSPLMRNAWDGVSLKTMVKHSPLKATDPHISVLGHITRTELIRHLTETEMANGLANRFMWAKVKRSKSLPFGGEWNTVNAAPITRRLSGILEFGDQNLRMDWADDARSLWCEAYEILTADRPGMFGAITARAEAQALRLSMLYALADCSYEIHEEHVESALAVWEYCEESARVVFGDTVGDPDADKVLSVLKERGELTRTEVSDIFDRNKKSDELDRIKRVLIDAGKIIVDKTRVEGTKKPVEVWRLA
jgi:hypothetical protein